MDDIMVSICVVTYNQEKYVGHLIESVLKQKVSFRYELLIADDASTDGTQEVLKKYYREHRDVIKLILRKKNVGANRNGFPCAMRGRGKYIASIDGDDFWESDARLQWQVDFLETHPEYVGVQDGVIVVDENDDPILEKNDDSHPITPDEFWRFDGDVYTFQDFCQWRMPGQISGLMYRNFFHDGRDYSVVYKFHPMIGDRTSMLQITLHGDVFIHHKKTSCYRLVTKKGAGNWIAMQTNQNRRFEEYKLMTDLERYAFESYGVKADLSGVKKNKLAGAVSVWFAERSDTNLEMVRKIIGYSSDKIRNVSLAIRVILWKWFCINILRKDKRYPI